MRTRLPAIAMRALTMNRRFAASARSCFACLRSGRNGRARAMTPMKSPFRERLLEVAPRAVAFLVFIAGTLMLFSGAVPAASGRLDALNRTLALPFIEISHFTSSLAGGALLLLARALQRRLDAGWELALLLLALGAALSLFKGWDVEEASLLGIAFLTLLPLRSQFYRSSSLLGEPFTRTWIGAIAAVLLASFLLLLFAQAQTPMAQLPWWDFALHAEAPRSERATIGAAALIGLFALYRLLSPVRPPLLVPDAAALEHARRIVEKSAATNANLALRGDKALLFSPAGDAFLMYGRRGRCWVALGEPIGTEQGARELVWQFHALCDRFDGWCVLFEVGEQWRSQCAELGLTLTPLGEEARVPLAEFTLDKPERKKLREVRSRLTRRGYRFRILSREEVASALPELEKVSGAWLTAKNVAEKGFSNGSFDRRYLAQFPVAIIEAEHEIVAFANLWLGAGKDELSIDLMRHLPTAANGTMDLLFSELMLWGRGEGYRWFNLGMAPLSNLRPHSQSDLWPYLGTLIFRHGEHFYNFEGLRRYKAKFEPVWRPLYLASPGGLALPAILINITALIAGSLSGVVTRRAAAE
jgi:phosphatidylglycerol lysyltransferase